MRNTLEFKKLLLSRDKQGVLPFNMEDKIGFKPSKTAGQGTNISVSAYRILLHCQQQLLPNIIANIDVFGTIPVNLAICLSISFICSHDHTIGRTM